MYKVYGKEVGKRFRLLATYEDYREALAMAKDWRDQDPSKYESKVIDDENSIEVRYF